MEGKASSSWLHLSLYTLYKMMKSLSRCPPGSQILSWSIRNWTMHCHRGEYESVTIGQKPFNATGAMRIALILALRTALFALLWWLLTEGRHGSWFFGAPLVLLTTAVSFVLAPHSPRSIPGLLRFVPFFIGHSLRGGIDVAWRALHPALPIAPILVDYRMRLSEEQARVFMANSASLLPGTLSAKLDGERLVVHVLDGHGRFREHLEALEQKVAALFQLPLTPEEGEE